MSALTRRGSRGLFLDLFELLDPLELLHLWLGGLVMRIEDGIQNGRYTVRAEMPWIDPQRQAEVTEAKGVLTNVALPESADEADIQASYDNGILEISVGLKADQAADHAGRSIPIRLVQHIKPT